MADIVLCPHCQTRVLPSGPQGVTCPSCSGDTTTAASASDRQRVAQRKRLAPRPSMVSVLAGAMIGQAIGYALYVAYVLLNPSAYDQTGGELGRMSTELAVLLAVYAAEAVLWVFNAVAFIQRWRFASALYIISTPIWLAAPTVLMVLGGHAFNEDNVRTLLGMNLVGVPLMPMMVVIYLYFVWVLTRQSTRRWLRGDAALDAVAKTVKAPA